MRAWPSVSAGYEELSLWDPPCQGLAAAQPVPAPCRVTAAAPAHPGACSGHGHGARRGRAGLWGRGCCGAGVPGPTSPSAPITAPVALPCSRVMASTSRCGGPRLRRALHSSLGGAGLGWEALHLPHGPPCPTASWALPSTHHCALPAPVHSPGPWGGGFPVPWGSPGQALTAAQATPGSAGLDTDPRLCPRGRQAWPRDRGLPVPLGGLPPPARRPPATAPADPRPPSLSLQPRSPALALMSLPWSPCIPPAPVPCAPGPMKTPHLPLPPAVPPVPVRPRPGGGPGRRPQQQRQDQHHRRAPHPATSGCGGTRTPGSGVALPGFGGRARGNPAGGEGRGLRELPRFQHGGDALARLGGCAGNAERLGPAGAAHPAHPPRYTLTPHTTEPVPPLAPGTHAPSPVGVSVPSAPPRGHVADTSRLCHRGRERPRPAQPAGNRNSNTQTHAARPGAAPGGTATRPL